ncbi:MAG: ribosomal protein S18-alanine N-acetyltransferase [Pseudomonadales bacterium]
MCAADLDSVLTIEKAICEVPWSRRNFQDCLDSDNECWIMSVDGQHAGHSVMSEVAGEAELLNISVDSKYQGLGLGRELLRYMLNKAAELNTQAVFLEVRESNSVAQSLYLSEGFNEVGLRAAYYPAAKGREDAVIMALEL